MKLPHKAHVAIIDGENFIVMRNDGQIFDPELSLEAKPDLAATNYNAGVRHQDDAGQRKGSTQLDELAHAAAAAEWLNAKAISGDMDDLLVIADPKTLGEMRRHYHAQLEQRLRGEIAKTLTKEPVSAIEKTIREA